MPAAGGSNLARGVLGHYSTVRVSDSLEQVLADPAVRAVAAATPATTHMPVAMAALRAAEHVLTETPLAATLNDGKALVRTAVRRGLVLMFDHIYCYRPAVRHLRELVRGGSIGELQFLDSAQIKRALRSRSAQLCTHLAVTSGGAWQR